MPSLFIYPWFYQGVMPEGCKKTDILFYHKKTIYPFSFINLIYLIITKYEIYFYKIQLYLHLASYIKY